MKKFLLLFLIVFGLLFLIPTVTKADICDESNKVTNGSKAPFDPINSGTNGIVPCGRSTTKLWNCTYASARRQDNFTRDLTEPFNPLLGQSNTNGLTSQSACNSACNNQATPNGATINNPPAYYNSQFIGPFKVHYCICLLTNNTFRFDTSAVPADNEAEALNKCQTLQRTVFRDLNPPQPPAPTVTQIGDTLRCRCELSHIFILGFNIYNFIVKNIATPLAALLFVIGGVMLVISSGNPNWVSLGKRIMWSAGIGLAIIFGSWLIINVVLMAIGYTAPWTSLPI